MRYMKNCMHLFEKKRRKFSDENAFLRIKMQYFHLKSILFFNLRLGIFLRCPHYLAKCQHVLINCVLAVYMTASVAYGWATGQRQRCGLNTYRAKISTA